MLLQCILGESLGVRGTVKKQRTLYMVGQTRVHVDQVEGLGEFMELEVGRTFVSRLIKTLCKKGYVII